MRNKILLVVGSLAIIFGSIYGIAHYAPAMLASNATPEAAAEPIPVPKLGPADAPGKESIDPVALAAQLQVSVQELADCQRRVKAPGEFNSLHQYTCAYIHMSVISLPLADPDKLAQFIKDWNPAKLANSDDLKMSGVSEDERLSRTFALIRRMRDALGNPEPFDYVHEPATTEAMRTRITSPTLEGGIGAQLTMENMWQIKESIFGSLPKDGLMNEEVQQKLNAAEVIGDGHRLVIEAPVMNGPSWGILQPGDIVTAVESIDPTDGKPKRTELDGMTMSDAAKVIRGTAGTTVTLHILRTNSQGTLVPLDLSILRAKVKESAVTIHDVDGIRRLTVTDFGNENLISDFHQALVEGQQQGVKGFIIDLRGNPGGRLDYVTAMLDMLVTRGEIIMSRTRNPGTNDVVQTETIMDGPAGILETKLVGESDAEKDFQPYKRVPYSDGYADRAKVDPSFVETHPLLTVIDDDTPVVVLVNGDSYSASEIFAGAILSTHRGLVVGQPTAGKNDIMAGVPLPECITNTPDKVCKPGGLDVIEGWFFPGGVNTDLTGVIPNRLVKPAEDYGKTDPQLDAAVAAVKEQVAESAARKAAADSSKTTNADRFREHIKTRNENDAKPVKDQDPHRQE